MKSLKPKLISSLSLLSLMSWARLIAFSLAAFASAGSIYAGTVWPGDSWPAAAPAELGLDSGKLEQARDYALTAGGSGHIIYQGKLVLSWGDPAVRYDLKSTTKSIGVTLLGIALKDGKVKLDDPANKHHPSFGVPPETNAERGWLDTITLRMLADQTAGFGKRGGYEPLLFKPGAEWSYSDGGPNWLAECLTLAYGRDLNEVMFERVFTPLGIKPSDLRWRNNQFRPHDINGVKRREFGSGIHANVDAMARIGYLYLREGRWAGEQILPPAFIQAVRNPDPALAQLPTRQPEDYGHASQHYSMLWWNNLDGTIGGAPRDAFWSWGLHDSLIVIVPSLDLVIARAGPAGTGWKRVKGADHYEVLKPFLEPIAAAAPAETGPPGAEASNPDRKTHR
jgi:CubicO group peptidase (beta-lactamase class C family)